MFNKKLAELADKLDEIGAFAAADELDKLFDYSDEDADAIPELPSDELEFEIGPEDIIDVEEQVAPEDIIEEVEDPDWLEKSLNDPARSEDPMMGSADDEAMKWMEKGFVRP